MTTRKLASGFLLLLTLAAAARADTLRWAPSPEEPVWNAAATNWLDGTATPTNWQPGAEALFDAPATAPVTLTENATASGLTFIADGYTLGGTGTLTVATLTAAPGTANRIDTPLRATSGLTKTGTGTVTLGQPNPALTTPVTVSEGTLALTAATLPNTVSVAQPATLAILPPATNGLTGFFYTNSLETRAFSTLATLEFHFSRLTPVLAVSSSLAGNAFDFGANCVNFPYPFNSEGYRTNDFQNVWRGTLTVPENTWYAFRVAHDDGMFLAIDRSMVIRSTGYTTTESQMIYLDAGPHDILLGHYQGNGGRTLRADIKQLYANNSEFFPLPTAWLTPHTSVAALGGGGQVTLAAGGAALNIAQKNASHFGGVLTGAADALFSKTDAIDLTLTAAAGLPNAFEGNVGVRRGTLALAAPERIGDASTVSIAPESMLRLAASETLGALTGPGAVTFSAAPTVSVYPFSGDADSGISASKTYTHLLDFPWSTGTPAQVNGVLFTPADMSGSANGYSWSTVNPPAGKRSSSAGTGGIATLLEDFAYDSLDYTLTLSGLTPGKTYETRLYFRSYSSEPSVNSTRRVTFAFTAGSVFAGSTEHILDSVARSIVRCRYTADAAGTLAIRVLSHHYTDTCHIYGLSNEELPTDILPDLPPLAAPLSLTAFTDDADSGISPHKAYTHLLDFPANGNPATVNGVTFTAADMSGSANGYGWITTDPPTTIWNTPQGIGDDTAREGVDRLLWDFQYYATDFTTTLTGLTPGQTYETRLYFRAFGNTVANSSRDVTFTFTAGATSLGSIDHDLDTITRSIVRCRYTADAAGTLSIRVVSVNSGNTCHLYGLSNEIVPEATLPALTLDTPAGRDARHTGAITGHGTLAKRGPGTQRLGGTIRLPEPIDIQAGTLTLEAGADISSGAAVQTGATLAAPNGGIRLGSLTGDGTFRLDDIPPYPVTNLIRTVFFTNDATTGISPDKTYTHLIDFGIRSPTAVINGVAFNKAATANGSIDGPGWANFPPSSHGGGETSAISALLGTGVYDLLYDMDYGHSFPDPATMRLTGLTPGKRYEIRLYNRSWSASLAGNRDQRITFDPDGNGPISETALFNPDRMLPHYLGYRYTAMSTELAISVQSVYSNQTYHLYGFTNEETTDADYIPATLDTPADCEFAGTFTGPGDWEKRGPATLTLTGPLTATGLLTVREGTLAIGGDRAYAGSVHIAGGWLRAGAAGECGPLAIAGDLTLAPGTILPWRHTATAADHYVVAGTVTLPPDGTLALIPQPDGIPPPARRPVIISQYPIDGPADLTGWTIDGTENGRLRYNADRTEIHFTSPRGTLILLR